MKYINRNDIFLIFHYLGMLMVGIGIMYLIPIVIDLIYWETNYLSFLVGSLLSIGVGLLLQRLFKKKEPRMRLKHAMIISSIAWLWAALIGAIIMMISIKLGFIDGFFENMSAWTGSGYTIFKDVEILPHSILFLRALEQWIGGLGVVVMVIGILTRPGTVASKLYKSEAREERIKPSITHTLHKTLNIYLIYTLAGIILYILAGMPLFDSICTTFTTIATGGMSIKNANIGYYQNDMIYIITMIIMILGATSFLVHYKVIKTKGKVLFKDVQFKLLIGIIVFTSLIIYLASNILPMDIVFHTISAITTTGASTVSSATLGNWPPFVLIILILLMMIGGSAGSTVGAIKLIRVITFFKGIYRQVKEIISPEGRVLTVKISGHKIPDKGIAESGTYITLYLVFIAFSWSIFCLYGYDPLKSLFEITSLQGNVGLGVGIVGSGLEPGLKLLSVFNMWAGRLEIIPVIILLRSFFEIIRK